MDTTEDPGRLASPLTEELGQMVAKLRERGNAMMCHPVANGTISHTEEAGDLLCEVASLVEKLAAERERSNLDARRYRKLRARGHSEIPLVVDPVYGEVTYSPAALDELLDDLPDPEA